MWSPGTWWWTVQRQGIQSDLGHRRGPVPPSALKCAYQVLTGLDRSTVGRGQGRKEGWYVVVAFIFKLNF